MNYKFLKQVIVRTPAKPIAIKFTIDDINRFLKDDQVKEAIFLSSPELLTEYEKAISNNTLDKNQKLITALLKYITRMHSRSTPFGLFAGCSLTEWSDDYLITKDSLYRSTRLDMNYSCALSIEISKLDYVRPYLKFCPNSSIYMLEDSIRYIEYYYNNEQRVYQLCSIDNNIYLQKIIECAKKGVTISELISSLESEEISKQEAFEFIIEIIDAQLLISELEPTVTGDELLSQTIKTLTIINTSNYSHPLSNLLIFLETIKEDLFLLDSQFTNKTASYLAIADKLKNLNVPFELGKLFQTDLYKRLNINKEPRYTFKDASAELVTALKVVNALGPRVEAAGLKEFKKKFLLRYDLKEVPLLEALDSELGIGYGENNNHTADVVVLLEGLHLKYDKNNDFKLEWNEVQSFLFKKLFKAKVDKLGTVKIDIDELAHIEQDWDDLPPSMVVHFSYVTNKNETCKLLLRGAAGPSAVNLLGRFASSNQEIHEFIKIITDKEKSYYQNAIIASVSYLPDSRAGNYLIKPALRDYNISYLANSMLNKSSQIPVEDLFVSIKDDRILLRSKSLDREIIPRIDNAHVYDFKSLPIYHFLGDLQAQNLRFAMFFTWGNLRNEYKFQPRVEVGNVIISLAMWQLYIEDITTILSINFQIESVDGILKKLRDWKNTYTFPDLILLVESDNELLVNLEDVLSIQMFISLIKNKKTILIKEFPFDSKYPVLHDNANAAYANEFFAVMFKEHELSVTPKSQYTAANDSWKPTARSFILGSEWLYYKFYCGIKIADKILIEVVKPLTEYLLNKKLIKKWFFIRYTDTDTHLRIRFNLTDVKNIGEVITTIFDYVNIYKEKNWIWKVQNDTYEREIERYGINMIELSEQLFYYDTEIIINALSLINNDDMRWRFVIRLLNETLNIFGFDLHRKREFLELLKDSFSTEFNVNKNKVTKLSLDRLYREKANELRIAIDTEDNMGLEELDVFFDKWKNSIELIIPSIFNEYKNNDNNTPLWDFLGSHIHMSLNRIFRSQQRVYELVIYTFLYKYYVSRIAKDKKTSAEII